MIDSQLFGHERGAFTGAVEGRRGSLESLIRNHSYSTDSVRKLLKPGAMEQQVAPVGTLADFLEVSGAAEGVVDEFLRDELNYVVVDSWTAAKQGVKLLKSSDGRATFLVHPEPNGHGQRHLPEPAIGPETGITARLSESLRLTNGFKDRAVDLLPRLSLCFLAEDRASAQRLATAYPHLYFLMPDGVCYHGHTVTGGKKSGAGPLAAADATRPEPPQVGQAPVPLHFQHFVSEPEMSLTIVFFVPRP